MLLRILSRTLTGMGHWTPLGSPFQYLTTLRLKKCFPMSSLALPFWQLCATSFLSLVSRSICFPLSGSCRAVRLPLRPLLQTGQPNVLSLSSSSTTSFVALLWLLPNKDLHIPFYTVGPRTTNKIQGEATLMWESPLLASWLPRVQCTPQCILPSWAKSAVGTSTPR